MTIKVPEPPKSSQSTTANPPLTSKDKKWYLALFIVFNLLWLPPTVLLGYSLVVMGLDYSSLELGVLALPVLAVIFVLLGAVVFGINRYLYHLRKVGNRPAKKLVLVMSSLALLVYIYQGLGSFFSDKAAKEYSAALDAAIQADTYDQCAALYQPIYKKHKGTIYDGREVHDRCISHVLTITDDIEGCLAFVSTSSPYVTSAKILCIVTYADNKSDPGECDRINSVDTSSEVNGASFKAGWIESCIRDATAN